MWSVQAPASSLNCPEIPVLEFQPIENESPIVLPWVEGGPSASCLTSTHQYNKSNFLCLTKYNFHGCVGVTLKDPTRGLTSPTKRQGERLQESPLSLTRRPDFQHPEP